MQKKRLLLIFVLQFVVVLTKAQLNSAHIGTPRLQLPEKVATPLLASTRHQPVYIPAKDKKEGILRFQKHRGKLVVGKCPGQPTLFLQVERAGSLLANLKWETKDAYLAENFIIERSLSDSLHFYEVNSKLALKGSGNKKNYKLPDRNDFNGITYYRIRQVDADSIIRYSNVVGTKGIEQVTLRTFPNPASEQVWIELYPVTSGKATILMYSNSGQVFQQQAIECTKGLQLRRVLTVKQLARGSYQIKIIYADKTFITTTFIKG